MGVIKASMKHKLGNVMSGFLQIIDGIVMIITFGNINSGLGYKFTKYRMFRN